ncbi:MAG: dihydropteroate synthase [Propionibacteriaceae bacterium]
MKPLATVRDLPQPGRTLVVGVVNVTPDSFSDGGEWFDPADAIRHGLELLDEGADIIDVGGESTRPGAARPDEDEELRRVVPVVAELASAGAVVSIDTMRPRVAAAAVAAGARLVNDVSGGRADSAMLGTVADLDVAYICMHWRGHSEDMQSKAHYDDVVGDVVRELAEQLEAALAAGIAADHLIVDPGFGFAKTGEHNWEILRHLDRLDALGFPVLIGVSRKAFLGTLLAAADGRTRPARARDDATVALTALVAGQNAWGVRVHAVRPNRDAIAVVRRWQDT